MLDGVNRSGEISNNVLFNKKKSINHECCVIIDILKIFSMCLVTFGVGNISLTVEHTY